MLRIFIAVFCCLLFISCAAPPVARIDPQEVIERAVIQSNVLESVRFQLRLSGKVRGHDLAFDGQLIIDGVLHSRGSAAKLDSFLDGTLHYQHQTEPVSLRATITMPSAQKVYVQIDQRQEPKLFLLQGSGMQLPLRMGSTPDQRLFALQAGAIDLQRDFGVEEMEGSSVYHYGVSLGTHAVRSTNTVLSPDDKSLLHAVQADGELWIDGQTFQLRRAMWILDGVAVPLGTFTGTADVTFHDFNRASSVYVPAGEALRVSPDHLFATIFSGSLLQSALHSRDTLE